MKKIFFALAIVAFGVPAIAQTPTAPVTAATKVDAAKAPKFHFPKGTTHDFGNLQEGPQAEYVFEFKNTGKTPLIIQAASAECGCTTPEFDKEPVKPGKTGKIKVKYNTQGRVGNFTKQVFITSNAALDAGQSRQILVIKGNVIGKANVKAAQ